MTSHPLARQDMDSFSQEEKDVARMLIDIGQGHILSEWDPAGRNDAQKARLLQQVISLDSDYPGGLSNYITRARELLERSREGTNPYDGWVPNVPSGERLTFGSDEYREMEQLGAENMAHAGFVIVAGGLGERLGYNGIKVSLPTEITTETCFLQYYISFMLAHQARARERTGNTDLIIPFAIMTSEDTHDRTVQLLEGNDFFGMESDQVTYMKQGKVAALADNDASIAMKNTYEIITKPHGHGDVHQLMHATGVAQKWLDDGIRWVIFFQDTNAPAMRGLVSTLGVSVQHNFAMNSLTYPRRPGEEAGGVAKLVNESQGEEMTINIEYNQLGPLLLSATGQGDVADASGLSPYPGNCNAFILRIDRYVEALRESNGIIAEFVNPKYTDETKTLFKKPTRLECMMQDYPKLLGASDLVGITQLPVWLSHRPVKNNVVDAIKKFEKTGEASSGASGEHAVYFMNREFLRAVGAKVEEAKEQVVYEGVPVPDGAKVVLTPSFATSLNEMRTRIKGEVSISATSTLVLDGDIEIQNLRLNGALIVRAQPGAKIIIENLVVENDGMSFTRISQDSEFDDKYKIRGYVLNTLGCRTIENHDVVTPLVVNE